jgi:hypothetical protein
VTDASAAQPAEHNASDPARVAGFKRIVDAGYRPWAVVIGGRLEMVWYRD